MINNRRGVSAVVANVLIILLVVVGVALIWAAVRPSIEKGTQGVQSDCFTIQLEPVSCVPLATIPTTNDLAVTIKRNPGDGALTGLKLIYEDDQGNSVATVDAQNFVFGGTSVSWSPPEILGSKTYYPNADVTSASWANVEQVTIAMQVGTGKNLCNVVHQPIPCV